MYGEDLILQYYLNSGRILCMIVKKRTDVGLQGGGLPSVLYKSVPDDRELLIKAGYSVGMH